MGKSILVNSWEQLKDGTWREATPYPYFVGWRLRKAKCECGKKFKNYDKYAEHYQEMHTLGKRYKRTKDGLTEL